MYSSCIINLSLHFRFLGKHLRMGRHSQKDGTDGKFMTSNANTIFRLIRMLSTYILGWIIQGFSITDAQFRLVVHGTGGG
jgi:hypothetical protein